MGKEFIVRGRGGVSLWLFVFIRVGCIVIIMKSWGRFNSRVGGVDTPPSPNLYFIPYFETT